MANYVSTQSGDWNNPATWGGSGYPQLAGDTCTISAGHTVVYNVSSTVELGQITVNGILKASRAVNTKLTLGYADIRVNSAGEVDWGKVADRIPDPVTAEILWNTTADNGKGFNLQGGKLYINGDPVYYGSDFDTTLFSPWTSGQTLYVTGDFSGKWRNGQEIYIHKYALYADYLTDTFKATINTITYDGTKSAITIYEAFPGGTFNAGGLVLNASRNVMLGKVGALTAIGNFNTYRPRLYSGNANSIITVADACFTGFGYYHSPVVALTTGASFTNTVFRNSFALLGAQAGSIYDRSLFISNNYVCYAGTSGRPLFRNCKILAHMYVFFQSQVELDETHIYGNQYGIYLAPARGSVVLFCNWRPHYVGSGYGVLDVISFYNDLAFYQPINGVYTGKIGWTPNDISAPNTTDLYMKDGTYPVFGKEAVFKDMKLPLSGLIVSRNETNAMPSRIMFEHYNQVKDAHYTFHAFADLIKNTSVLRTGGAPSSIEVVPLSNCSTINDVMLLEWYEENVPAMQHTRSIYMRGEGWTEFPLHTELYFEAEYYDQASGVHTAKAQSTTVLANNIDWTEFPVTFTPAQSGRVTYRAYLKKYQAAAKVYVDTQLNRLGMPAKRAVWSMGESKLTVSNYDDVSFNMPLETVNISSQYEVIEL